MSTCVPVLTHIEEVLCVLRSAQRDVKSAYKSSSVLVVSGVHSLFEGLRFVS